MSTEHSLKLHEFATKFVRNVHCTLYRSIAYPAHPIGQLLILPNPLLVAHMQV